jgi:AcrR family transcriptional regulator
MYRMSVRSKKSASARGVDAVDATTQRQERVRARAREDILRAAAKTFAREGLDASMQSIAREAGYAAPSLYSYFAKKEDIALALVTSLRAAFLATFDHHDAPELPFDQRLEALVRRQMDLADERRDDFAVFFAMSADGQIANSGSLAALVTGFEVLLDRMAVWLRTDFEEPACADLACLVVGTLYAFFRRWIAGRAGQRLAADAPQAVRLLLAASATSARKRLALAPAPRPRPRPTPRTRSKNL